ncbi:MAG TPA: tetratricopeptide repeat protein [Candidatus Cloacimonadota bacterium]|nr:tetratricopeptide repeat protein [Candidatus Cloacimonadota bacterium]
MQNLEELKKKLHVTMTVIERLQVLDSIAKILWKEAEFSEAKKYAELSLELARSQGIKNYEASACYLLGLTNAYLNNYDVALDYQYKALRLHQEIDNSGSIAEDYNNIGKIYINLNNYEKALENFLLALEYNPGLARSYNNLSHVYNYLHDYEHALEYGKKALEYSSPDKNDHPDIERTHIFAHLNLGEIYLNRNQINDAISTLSKALELSQKHHNDTPLLSHYYLGLAYQKKADYTETFHHLRQAMQLAEHHENKEYLLNIYRGLYEVAEIQGDLEQALHYLKKHVELDKKIYTKNMADRLAKLQTVYEVETNTLKAQQMAEKVSKLASLGVMAAGITHEINQPLCAIKVSAESILYWNKKHNEILPPNFTEALHDISEAANYIDDIIQHMRSFWNVPEKTVNETISLNDVLSSALGLIERQLYSHGIFLELALQSNLPSIRIDRIQMEQIIINVVINAMHALDETIKTNKRIIISTWKENEKVKLAIKDNGIGLPANIGKRIFDPFFSTKNPGKGMGLGLAIVKTYLDKNKAQIIAENNDQGGATFTITFDLLQED